MTVRGLIAGAALLAALAGCGETNIYVDGGGASGPDAPDGPSGPDDPSGPDRPDTPDEPDPAPSPDDPLAGDLLDIAGDFDAMGTRADDLAATTEAAMPVGGAATYKGSAEMTLGTGTDAALLYGDARIRADFDDGTVSGDIDNVIGQVGGGAVQEFDGSVDIDEWVGDPGSPSTGALASGELTAGATVLTIDATLNGGFLGPDATTIGLWAEPGDATGSINGDETDAGLVLWGEQVWRGP